MQQSIDEIKLENIRKLLKTISGIPEPNHRQYNNNLYFNLIWLNNVIQLLWSIHLEFSWKHLKGALKAFEGGMPIMLDSQQFG